MASFGVNPASPEPSKSSWLPKTCPSSTGSESTSHNHCDEVLADELIEAGAAFDATTALLSEVCTRALGVTMEANGLAVFTASR
jgi:hypothetical protein